MEYELLLRIAVAGACGLLIGWERKSRMKEAGIRTHFVAAVGAALMMAISKYGFRDLQGDTGIALDPSRIAAQVVSGVGFLGAGMIFMQRQTIKGLTTAAGLWVTAGIGMAIGADLYVLGIGVTVLILAGQKLLHSGFGWVTGPRGEQLTIGLADEDGAVEALQAALHSAGAVVLQFHAEKLRGGDGQLLQLDMIVKVSSAGGAAKLLPIIQRVPQVLRVETQ
ncbi:MgtC/SapB family protein [Paenibacillus sacheonensis]|uniref:MgtC/SapB family protein n=1 Tax=Paenibacillus sacheonensis TaxID=742054 RepID=A0A7X4YSR5_9BACL|nr:MgtC/SapB family protein [Paenibacillus sacheonensis]MBM7567133.1 putative Mg2+ transporter-C (MgtC) family protein [Paenibacillus sacheonensis]NBC70941.1 MgtC/SapB family protein [Paenibacillus sacheonensis]